MRFVFFLLLVAGLALGVGYPWVANNLIHPEMGSWRVYDPQSGFKPVTVTIAEADQPVTIVVGLTGLKQTNQQNDAAVLTLTAAHDGETVLAKTLSFNGAAAEQASPQAEEKLYRETAGVIELSDAGDYVFTVGQGDAEGVRIAAVDLVLQGGKAQLDPRAQPIGYALIVIGFIGLVISFVRKDDGGRPQNPNSQPPPRWGRGRTVVP